MARRRKERTNELQVHFEHLNATYGGGLNPPLEGYAYRFTVYLPLLCEGKEVFIGGQRALLADLFHICCGGFSESSSEGGPSWLGSWLPPDANRPIVDRHTLMVVYTPQIEEAKRFFGRLKWILQQKNIADQQVILIEHTAVWLVESFPPE